MILIKVTTNKEAFRAAFCQVYSCTVFPKTTEKVESIFMLFRTFFEAFRYDKLKKVFLQMFTLFRNLVTFGNFTNLLLKTFAKTHFLSLLPQLR